MGWDDWMMDDHPMFWMAMLPALVGCSFPFQGGELGLELCVPVEKLSCHTIASSLRIAPCFQNCISESISILCPRRIERGSVWKAIVLKLSPHSKRLSEVNTARGHTIDFISFEVYSLLDIDLVARRRTSFGESNIESPTGHFQQCFRTRPVANIESQALSYTVSRSTPVSASS
jgi:hypothetical protein